MNEKKKLPNGYVSMGKHVALLLLTFGIYYLVWIYKTSKYLNEIDEENFKDPTTSLLLCMFVPLYYIYWFYKQAGRFEKIMLKGEKMSSDFSTIMIILAIFVGILAPVIFQSKINDENISAPAYHRIRPAVSYEFETINIIDGYKRLFEKNEITIEEYKSLKDKALNERTKHQGEFLSFEEAEKLVKAYSVMLDSGAITEEEFEVKKMYLMKAAR